MSVIGKVIQVAGPAVDVEFPEGQIPVIRTAIRITSEGYKVPTPSISSAKWRSISARAACAPLRCSRPMVWCAA